MRYSLVHHLHLQACAFPALSLQARNRTYYQSIAFGLEEHSRHNLSSEEERRRARDEAPFSRVRFPRAYISSTIRQPCIAQTHYFMHSFSRFLKILLDHCRREERRARREAVLGASHCKNGSASEARRQISKLTIVEGRVGIDDLILSAREKSAPSPRSREVRTHQQRRQQDTDCLLVVEVDPQLLHHLLRLVKQRLLELVMKLNNGLGCRPGLARQILAARRGEEGGTAVEEGANGRGDAGGGVRDEILAGALQSRIEILRANSQLE